MRKNAICKVQIRIGGIVFFRHIINRIYRIMNVEELRYKITGAAMAVHINFGAASLERKHKYRVYRPKNPPALNSVNSVNSVSKRR